MAEQPRNAAAGEKQRQYKKTEVKSIADQFEQAGLTRKNIDYMIQLNKQLDLQGADPDAKATMLEQTVMKLTESQKQGTTARTLLGTPTEYADQLIHPAPSAKQVERSASGLLAIDNALMFFAIFTVMFGIMGLSQPKSLASSNGNAGIVSILIVSIVGGLLFGYMTRLLTSTKGSLGCGGLRSLGGHLRTFRLYSKDDQSSLKRMGIHCLSSGRLLWRYVLPAALQCRGGLHGTAS